MLTPGRKVTLTYYDGTSQVESYGWLVQEYDNGLLKVYNLGGKMRIVSKKLGGTVVERLVDCEASGPVIFNLRSIGFLKAELVEQADDMERSVFNMELDHS